MFKRLNYLDYAKGISIVLVVLGHIIYTQSPIKIWLYSFHLPLFFFISGCLLRYKNNYSFNNILRNRIRTIMFPYFAFSLLLFPLWIFQTSVIQKVSLNLESVSDYFIKVLTLRGPGALWFLPCLFLVEVSFVFILNHIKNTRVIYFILLFSSFIPFIIKEYTMNKFVVIFLRVLVGIFFFGIGYYLFNYVNSKKINKKLIILGLMLINVITSIISGFVDLYSLELGNYFLYYISAVSGMLCILLMCKTSLELKPLRFLGSNSLIIMATHQELIRVFLKILQIITNETNEGLRKNLPAGLIVLLFVLLAEIPIIYIINNYIPFILGRKSKKQIDKTMTA